MLLLLLAKRWHVVALVHCHTEEEEGGGGEEEEEEEEEQERNETQKVVFFEKEERQVDFFQLTKGGRQKGRDTRPSIKTVVRTTSVTRVFSLFFGGGEGNLTYIPNQY